MPADGSKVKGGAASHVLVTVRAGAGLEERQRVLDTIRRIPEVRGSIQSVVPIIELGQAHLPREELLAIQDAKEGGWGEHDYSEMIQKLLVEIDRARTVEMMLQAGLSEHLQEKMKLRQEVRSLELQLAQQGVAKETRVKDPRVRLERMPDGKTGRVWVDFKIDEVQIESCIASQPLDIAQKLFDGHLVMDKKGELVEPR